MTKREIFLEGPGWVIYTNEVDAELIRDVKNVNFATEGALLNARQAYERQVQRIYLSRAGTWNSMAERFFERKKISDTVSEVPTANL